MSLFDIIEDELLYSVKNAARRHRGDIAWDAYTRAMLARDGRNEHFNNAIDLLVNNWEDIVERHARRGDSDGHVATEYIPKFIVGHMAAIVTASPEIVRNLTRAEEDELLDEADAWSQRFGGRGRRSSSYGDRDRDDRRRDDRSRGRRDDRRDHRSRGRRDDRDYRDDRDRGRDGRDRPRREAASTGDHWDAVADAGPEREVRRESRREPDDRRRDRDDRRDDHVRTEVVEPQVAPPAATMVEGYDYSKSHPHYHFFKNGNEYQLAAISDWTITPVKDDEGVPLPRRMFDPRTTLLYLVKDEFGTITEEGFTVTEDSRYALHEQLYAHSGGVEKEEEQYIRPRRDTVELEEEKEEDNRPAPSILNLMANTRVKDGDIEVVTDVATGVVKRGQVSLNANQSDRHLQVGMVTEVIFLKGDREPQEELVTRFGAAASLTEAHSILVDNVDLLEPKLYAYLNNTLTQYLLTALRYQFQFGHVKGFDFANDWLKVLPYLEEKVGREFTQVFTSRCRAYLSQVVARSMPEDHAEWLDGMLNEAEQEAFNGIVFLKREFVVLFDYTLDEIGIGKALDFAEPLSNDDRGVSSIAITNRGDFSSILMEFYQALPYVASRTLDITRVRVVTNDDKEFSIIPHKARAQNFILFK